MNVKTGRPVDIRTLGGGWAELYEGFVKKSEDAKKLKEKWDREHPISKSRKTSVDTKI